MKRTSGRIGVGLVLVSMLVGACLTERESGDASIAVARPEAALPDTHGAQDIVVAVRSQLERSFGKMKIQVPGENAHRSLFNAFNDVGMKSTSSVEFLGMQHVTGEVGKVAAEVVLPAHADGAFRLQDARSGVSIEVGLVGATKSVREDADGYTVYRAGYDKGAHIVHRTTFQGTEDYVFFPDTLPETPQLRYELALGENVAGLRLVENTLEMLDSGGAPRLRMAPPYAVDGDGRRLVLNVAIEGCAYDSSAELPWNRPVVAPGAKHCIVRLSWDSNARAPLAVDPAWVLTGELSVPRLNATSMELPNTGASAKARVIVVGGDPGDPTKAHQTTEVFDESTNTWAMHKSLLEPRTQHAMVPFAVQNVYGLVIIGGRNGNGVLQTSEKLDTTTMTWQKLGNTGLMTTSRVLHTATAVEGSRIVVTGGINNAGDVLNSVEVFYSTMGIWQAIGTTLSVPRIQHTATLGKNGSVVVIAGGRSGTSLPPLASLDYCDATTDVGCGPISPVLVHGRANHKAIREVPPPPMLPRIFFIGGESGTSNNKLKDVEVFDAGLKTFLPPVGQLSEGRSVFDAILVNGSPILGGGSKIIASGGYGDNDEPLASTELLDTSGMLANKTWQKGPDMMTPRAGHTMATLTDGRILAMGGSKSNKGTSEVMQCTSNADCAAGLGGKFCVDGFCCDTACDGVCEACNSNAPGHTPGTCFPIAGRPVEGHGDCIGKKDDANSLKCEGQCGGFDRVACVYPVGKPCAKECADGKAQSLTCSELGVCDVTAFETSCGNYTCDTDTNQTCLTKCAVNDNCITGYECNVTSGSCVEAQVRCSTRPDPKEDIQREVLESVADPTVIVEGCGNFRCVNSACLKFCDTAYDCISNPDAKPDPITYVCDDSRQCVRSPASTTGTDGTGCATAPGQQSSRFGWLAALAMAGAVAARRNRARA